MYNRYIPQSDGTFHRSSVPDPEPENSANTTNYPKEPDVTPEKTIPTPRVNKTSGKPAPMRNAPMQYRNQPLPEKTAGSVGSFLKGLLPQNFDTEDLIVVLLLLLISGNNTKDQNAALMTLGIYLFL